MSRALRVDELEWSDEEDDVSRYTLKVPAQTVLDIEQELDNEEHGSGLIDHKRSKIFSGSVKCSSPNAAIGAAHVRSFSDQLWVVCRPLTTDSSSSRLVPLEALSTESFSNALKELLGSQMDEARWRKLLAGFELDDFLPFNQLVDLITSLTGSKAIHNCSSAVTVKTTSTAKCSRLCACVACLSGSRSEDQRRDQDRDQDSSDSHGLDKHTVFRLEVVYRRLVLELHGKVRVRHLPVVLKELGLPHDASLLPKAFWNQRGDLIVASAAEMLDLVGKVRIEEQTAPDPMAALFRYPLPAWLREEFKVSEILLYQHHFFLIDSDGGGGIDEYELQTLFQSLGAKDGNHTALTVEQARAIIAEYDLDGGGTIDFMEFMVLIYKVQRGALALAVDSGLAQVLAEAKAQLKIFEEIEEVSMHPPEGCAVISFGGSPVHCLLTVTTMLGVLRIEIVFHEGYPYFPPELRVLDRLVCVNVCTGLDGSGRLLHLNEVWQADWSIADLLVHLMSLLPPYPPQPQLLPDRFLVIVDEWQRRVAEVKEEDAARRRKEEEEQMLAEQQAEAKAKADAEAAVAADAIAAGTATDTGTAVLSVIDGELPIVLDEHQVTPASPMEADGSSPAAEQPPASPKPPPPLIISFDMVTSAELKARILTTFPRVEQMHLSLLFLFATDYPAFLAYADQVARKWQSNKNPPTAAAVLQ